MLETGLACISSVSQMHLAGPDRSVLQTEGSGHRGLAVQQVCGSQCPFTYAFICHRLTQLAVTCVTYTPDSNTLQTRY